MDLTDVTAERKFQVTVRLRRSRHQDPFRLAACGQCLDKLATGRNFQTAATQHKMAQDGKIRVSLDGIVDVKVGK